MYGGGPEPETEEQVRVHECEVEGSGSNTTVAETPNTTVAELNSVAAFSVASLVDLLPEGRGGKRVPIPACTLAR